MLQITSENTSSALVFKRRPFKKNYGQRIDHVIAQPSLLEDKSDLRITAFDTLIQFGASRKGSSDHCPLWFKMERGHSQPVLAVDVKAARRASSQNWILSSQRYTEASITDATQIQRLGAHT